METSNVKNNIKNAFKRPKVKDDGTIEYAKNELGIPQANGERLPTATYAALKMLIKEQSKNGGKNNMLNRYPWDIPKDLYPSSSDSEEEIPHYTPSANEKQLMKEKSEVLELIEENQKKLDLNSQQFQKIIMEMGSSEDSQIKKREHFKLKQ